MSHLPDNKQFGRGEGSAAQPVNEARTAPLTPRLSVVGAGIGDPDLLTLKAVKVLRTADVVLYDALVNEAILQHAPATAALVYVGKRKGAKAYTQDEINERIVAYAHCCGHVVRLKGGDPLVFGRGHEEMQFAQQHGIETDYVPGISSAIAAAGVAGIPVTLRGASRGFWVITGTTDTGELNPDIYTAAQTDATVVVLMGVTKLAEIADVFKSAGKADLPVAVVQNASLPQQREVFGTVANINEAVQASDLGSPAIVVLGEVVRHRHVGLDTKSLVQFLNPEFAAQ